MKSILSWPPGTLYAPLLRSAGSAVGSRLGATLIGVFTFSVLARTLGSEGLGEYRTVLTLLLFASVMFDFGLYSITLRELSADRADAERILGNAVALRVIAMVGATALLSAIVALTHESSTIKWGVLIAALGWVAYQLTDLLRSVFQLHLAQHYGAIAEITGTAITLLLVSVLASLHAGPDGMLAATTAGFCMTAFLAWLFANRLIPIRLHFEPRVWRALCWAGLPIAASGILQTIQLRADVLLLALLRPVADVGLYNAPLKLYELLYAIPYLLAGLILPLLVRDRRGGNESIAPRLSATLTACCMLSALAFAVLFLNSKAALSIIAGEAFVSASPSLRILVLATVFVCITCVLRVGAVALNLQSRFLRADIVGVCASVIAHCVLIPRYGAIGAALGKLIGDCATCFTGVLVMRRQVNPRALAPAAWTSVGALIIIGSFSLIDLPALGLLASSLIAAAATLAVVLCVPRLRRALSPLRNPDETSLDPGPGKISRAAVSR